MNVEHNKTNHVIACNVNAYTLKSFETEMSKATKAKCLIYMGVYFTGKWKNLK